MFRQWLRRHVSLSITVVSGAVVAVLVLVAAVVSGGYTAQRLDLDDASVWVANGAQQYVGRANTEVLQLDTVVSTVGTQVEVVQQGATIIAVDRADARADIIDPATAKIEKSVPLPPEEPEVFLAGTSVAVYSQGTGQLWMLPAASFASFDSEQPATLNLGANTIVSVDDTGVLTSYSSDLHQVGRVNLASGSAAVATSRSTLAPQAGDRLSVGNVGRHWAVLDASTAAVEVDGTVVDLSSVIGSDGSAVLQQASSAGSAVLVAWSGGLVSVPFTGGTPEVVASGRSGSAAAPLIADGCTFAAWTGGTAVRACGTSLTDSTQLTLSGVAGGARLALLHNGDRVLLNDGNGGTSWAVQRNAQPIDNWSELITQDQNVTDVRPNDDASDTVVEKDQQPPIAIDDELGARPGRSSTLPVLLNDYDPNGDVLVIDGVDAIDPTVGTIDLIGQRQQLQLNLAATATGTLDFDYTISDGRGGTATATVTVAIRAADENSAPRQVRTTRSTVEAGGQGTFSALGDWVDPDGDPIYLTSASVQAPDHVNSGPDGTVVVSPATQTLGTIAVALVVSDGTAEGTGSAEVKVAAPGSVPIVADPFVVLATAGEELTISPLEHVHGGAGTITLNAVPPRSGVTLTPSYEAGTFRFESDEIRTHYIDYVVTDGVSTVTGTVRVEVTSPPDVNSTPITVPKTVFVHTLSSATVNVAATDIDPAGGVLLVSGTSDPPEGSGVKAAVLNQESVRVTLTALLAGPVSFAYTVTNGLASATGSITVIEIPDSSLQQPPVARDDTATARVGDVVTIDVLANDDQPDGLPITLDPHLVEGLSGDSGLLFASGSTLRYLAPDHPGNFSAVYQVAGPDGQTAQAQVHIEVREPNLATNNAPVPQTVTARVLAGQAVRVDIPLTGIDPDGDSVQLLGQETNPQKGAVTGSGPTYLEYTAGDYSAGTDSFTYTVIDALGARATGTIRIGIAPRPAGARDPVATQDSVLARPGSTVSVQVLSNDFDPDGGSITVISAVPTDAATTAVVETGGSVVTVTPPASALEGSQYSVLYTIENATGGQSQAFITVKISSSAPLSYPVANDTTLTLSDILGRTTIDVDVLRNVFFADGPNSELGLSVLPGYGDSAVVTADKKIRVTVGDTSQIIPFAVSHPDDPTIASYALIRIPGFNDALPQLARDFTPLTVNSEQPLTIDLDKYVVTANGNGVHLTDTSTVQATHANGAPLVVNDHTLSFTSADHYSGPASISFEVTDGTSATDPDGHKATLVLPITVTQRDNAPPVFIGAGIEFEPGQSKTINLVRLTNYPHPEDQGELAYTVIQPLPTGFSYELRGQQLVIRANEDAAVGSTTGITLAVRDSLAQGQSGRITLSVISSTRPLVDPQPDVALTRRGETTTIDVLDNDESTNPFPDQPLRVIGLTGASSASLPAGVTVTASNNNSRLTVSVAATATPGDTSLQYQVADATNDPKRYTFGVVKISIQDVPDTPVAPVRQADQLVGGELKLRITPPQQNNSVITGYRIVSTSHGQYEQDCGLSTICSLGALTVGADYRFSVIATNAVGDSVPSPLSDSYTVDYKPAAPASVTAVPSPASVAPNGKSITVTWPSVPDPNPGTPVIGYTVLISGANVTYTAKDVTSPFVTTAGGGLVNDASYTVTVYARNSAQVISDSEWRRTTGTVHTVGPPSAPSSGPSATLTADQSGNVRVGWGSSDPNGASGVSYSVGRFDGSVAAPTCSTGDGKPGIDQGATGVTSPWVDTNAVDGAVYTYVVYADNGIYCTASASGAIESKRPPEQVSGTISLQNRDGAWDIHIDQLTPSPNGVSPARFEYSLNGVSGWVSATADAFITSRADSSVYGTAVSVYFRGCRDDSEDYCSAASAGVTATPYDTRATVTQCVQGSVPTIDKPSNSGNVAVVWSLAYSIPLVPGDPSTDVWSGFDYSESDTVPSGADAVQIEATSVDGAQYSDPYPQSAGCSAP